MPSKRLLSFAMAFYVFLYRRSRGAIGGRVRGMPVLLLVTTGRKTGTQRTVPVMYFRDGNNYVVTASNGGRDQPPAWWLNLQRNPVATIEVGDSRQAVVAEPVGPEAKRRLWAQLAERAPFFEGYQQRTSREIPMVMLRPVNAEEAMRTGRVPVGRVGESIQNLSPSSLRDDTSR